jgi:hypothetical protein
VRGPVARPPFANTIVAAWRRRTVWRNPSPGTNDVRPPSEEDGGLTPPVFLGLHVPKCAGTTLLRRAASRLPGHAVHQSTSHRTNFLQGNLSFLALARYDQLRFVFGHSVHEEMIKRLPVPPILFTGLREPEARLRSYLGWQRHLRDEGHPTETVEEALSKTRDPMCWFIIKRFPTLAGTSGTPAERSMNALRGFTYCYFPDTLERFAKVMFRQLGIEPRKTHHRIAEQLPPDVRIDPDILKNDKILYELAREHFMRVPLSRDGLSPTERVIQFHSEPPRQGVLRDFLHQQQMFEYRGWNILADVRQHLESRIDELQLELAAYSEGEHRKRQPNEAVVSRELHQGVQPNRKDMPQREAAPITESDSVS